MPSPAPKAAAEKANNAASCTVFTELEDNTGRLYRWMQQGDLRFPGLSCFPADSEAELLLRETNTALQVLALLLFERLCVFAGL